MSFKDKSVLVTGADGFIGSHLAEALARDGARVRAFCFYNSNGSRGWLDGCDPALEAQIDFRLGDIRDARFVEEACRDVEVVFHLAALIAIPYSYTAPESFVDTNVRGTLNVLEAVKRAGCRRLVQTSTSEVYGTPQLLPIRESHPLQSQSPYSATKIAADKLCEAYHCSYGLPVVTIRPFNTYGPRQSARAVIPTILTQLLRGQSEISLGSLVPKRDLTFIDDTVRGFLAAGHVPGIEGRVVQLGTGRAESVADVFETACRVLGVKATVKQEQQRLRPDKSEVMVLRSDPTLARELLGWQATVELEQGLKQTADWLRSELGRFRAGTYVV